MPTPGPHSRSLPRAALAVALAAAAACAPDSPEDRIAALRSRYTASLNSFAVEQTPLEPAAEAPADTPLLDPIPTRDDVMLDVLVQRRSDEPLPGLTLDVTQVDGERREKRHYRIWIDVSQITKGRGQSVSHRLPDVDFEEGDGFHVEVRHPVPPEERGEYREFSPGG